MPVVCRVLWVVLWVAACGGSDTPASPPVLEDGPPAVSSSGETTVVFHAPGADRFECQLDDLPAVACASPYTITVGDGMHTLTITAFDGDARLPDPIVITWLVDTTPPDTSITTSPAAVDNSTTTTFEFAGVPASDTAGFECALDGAAFAACTSPHPVTTTTGAHTFAVRAHDAAGNIDASPAQHAWTIDTTMLDTTITSGPGPSAKTQGAVTFTFTASEAGATFECQIDALSYAPCSTPAQFTGLAEGSHTFSVRAKKGAAVDPTPATRTWTVDLTAPPVAITSTPPAESNDATPTFAFASTDPEATFECQIDGVYPYAACTSPWTSQSLFQAAQTFRVRATDTAGNSAVATHTWNVDLTAPIVSIDSGPGLTTQDPNITFTFSATGLAVLFECQIDGLYPYAPCTSPYTRVLPGGDQTFRVRATDAAGNVSNERVRNFTVDLPGPTVSITSGPPTLPAVGNLANVSFAWTTAGSVASIDCSLDGGAFTACTSPTSYTGLTDGDHMFTVRVRDAAMNAGTASWYFRVDTTPPVITPWFGPPAITHDRHPVVGIGVDDIPADRVGILDGVPVQANYPPGVAPPNPPQFAQLLSPQLPLADGPHTFAIRVYDAAHNYSEHTYSFTVDATGPSLTIDTGPAVVETTSNIATFTFSGAGATSFECQLDNAPFATCTSPHNALVADGTHTFRIRAFDANGASTIKSYAWTSRPTPRVTTSTGAYDTNGTITVTWSGLPGNLLDWVAVAPQGSSDTTFTQRVYTNGAKSGSATLPGVANGTYVARAYVNDTFTKVAESAKFAVLATCAPLSFTGTTHIRNAGDMASLAPYTDLDVLIIDPTVAFAVDLPCLRTATQILVNDSNGAMATAIRAPRLVSLASSLGITNGPATVEFPSLTTLTGLAFTGTLPDLSSFDRLTSFTSLYIDVPGATVPSTAFPGVTSLATLTVNTNVRFDGLNNLTTVTDAQVSGELRGLNRLTQITGNATFSGPIGDAMRSLVSIGGDATFNSMWGAQTARIASLETVGGHLLIKPSPFLGGPPSMIERIELPQLKSAYRVTVDGTGGSTMIFFSAPQFHEVTYGVEMRNLVSLQRCEYWNIVDQFYPNQPMYIISPNAGGDDGTCLYNF